MSEGPRIGWGKWRVSRVGKIAKPPRLKVVKKNLSGEKLARVLTSHSAVTEPKDGTVIVEDDSIPF